VNIYLDIETIPGQAPGLKEQIAEGITPPGNYKKPETIAQWEAEQKPALVEQAWRGTAFAGDIGEVVCIAWAVDDEPAQVTFRGLPGQAHDYPEADVLGLFFAVLKGASQQRHGRLPTFIGHNVREFDLRFLFQRAVILGVRPAFPLPHNAGPGSDRVYDTMEAWAGWRNRVSLDRLCKALGIPCKGAELGGEAIDGSKVWDFVQAGRIEDVAAYCKADVERVRAVHRRLTFADAGMKEEAAA